MATFTIELNELVKNYDIGLSDYPIFEDGYRAVLNKHIIDSYFFHEIGFETAEMFVHQLNTRMRLKMPAFNKLYESTLLEIDPMLSMSLRTVSENEREASMDTSREQDTTQNATSTADNQSDTTGKSRTVSSQFPQTMLSGSEDYATSAVDAASENKTAALSNENTNALTEATLSGRDTETGVSKSDTLLSGFTGSAAALVMKYRESIINVDQMVVEELADLFMSVVDTPDSITPQPLYRRGAFPFFGAYGFGHLGYRGWM